MQVTVIGKEHVEGVSSKTGEVFSMDRVYFVHRALGVEGQASSSFILPRRIKAVDVQLNKVYNLDFDSQGHLVDFSRV